MKVRIVALVLCCLAAVVQAQPTVTFSGDVMEGQVAWYNNGWQAQSFVGDAGSVSLGGITGALGQRAFILPTYVSWAGVSWQGQGQERIEFGQPLNDVIGPFSPRVTSPAPIPVGGGGTWTIVVRNANAAQATALGISDTLSFSVAAFSSAKKRTDGIPTGNGQMYANGGAAFVTIPNVQYFPAGEETSYRVILGSSPQTVQGTAGSYVATIGGMALVTKDVYGYDLATNGHVAGANWSLIDLTWTFTAQ